MKVPKGWSTTKLRQIGQCIGGLTYSPDDVVDDTQDGILVLRSSNIKNGELSFNDNVYVRAKLPANSLTRKDDILVCVRNGSRGLIGKSAQITGVGVGVAHGAFMMLFRAKESAFVYQLFQSREYFRQVHENLGATINSINGSDFLGFGFLFPPEVERAAIANLLSTWDTAVKKTEQLIAAKNRWLNYLREHQLTKPKPSTRVKLKAATHESTARNGKRLGRKAIMAVTKQVGMRPMREETIAAAIDRYKVVRPRAFAYNPMRLNIGSIAISSFDDDVLVSPDYVVFECDETKLLPSYLNHLRRTRLWASHFEAAGSGGVRIRIYYDDLAAFVFPLPSLIEQERVLAVLDSASEEIEVLERYLAALKKQKRGLMQKLLTGQWRIKTSKETPA